VKAGVSNKSLAGIREVVSPAAQGETYMDLSFLKWPSIIGAIVLVGWLASSGGVDYMYKKFTTDQPGGDAKKDELAEAGLSRLGGYTLKLFKYDKTMEILETAITRYPEGKNVWHNKYRMVKCAEKLGDYRKAVDLIRELMDANASEIDSRVPNNDNLRLRSDKLIEMHELEKR
jgi:tetratricopeptide (TPR) repeat protein